MDRNTPEYLASLNFLLERINFERSTPLPYTKQHYRLNRMRRLLEILGDPHLACPVIHVAGTKGKGSVAWMMAETLRRAGYRTGLYTSPHLVQLEERFVVQGQACRPEQLVAMVELLRPAEAELSASEFGSPTFFELTTAIAWLLFRECKTNAAVIEVGLGGRLDSTNVCSPSLSIITSISLDHQQQLGDTIGRIAGEKAGIIKQGIPVVSGATASEAAAVIEHVAYQNSAPLWQLDRDFVTTWTEPFASETTTSDSRRLGLGSFDFEWKNPTASFGKVRRGISLRLLGEHQSRNASLVAASVDVLNQQGWSIPETSLVESLEQTEVTARMQVVEEGPWLLIDSAHNIASIQALTLALQQHFRPRRRILVFSASKDKDYAKMLQVLLGCFDSIILTQFQSNPRAVSLEALATLCNNLVGGGNAPRPMVQQASTPEEALAAARKLATPDDLICVTGSFFLAAEILPHVSLK